MDWEVGQLPTDPLLYTQLQLPRGWMFTDDRWEWDDTDGVHLFADGNAIANNNNSLINCQQTTTTTDEYANRHVTSKVNKVDKLEFEDVQKYFDKPISVAAKELRTGLTLLKKRCRKLGIKRWPHRKIKSLDSLIRNLKELGMVEEVSMLEGQRRMLQKQPHMELNERAKKIRHKSFKANYHRKRIGAS